MATSRVVVDGSNIATEGRSTPSLAQLDEAVRQLQQELPNHEIIVVVDATFGHRIDPSERPRYEEAEAHGELISPPAGTIGRGDAFLLQVAARANAVVLSNDSFQEFHGDHPWLFEPGRLLGGKPIPGVGWVFTPRTPVRGSKSRKATAAAKATKRTAAPSSLAAILHAAAVSSPTAADDRTPGSSPLPPPSAPSTESTDGRRRRQRASAASETTATPTATVPAPTPPPDGQAIAAAPRPSGRRAAEPVNEPLTFLTFIADHPVGSTVEATVEGFVSHGAMVQVGDMRCYVPLRNLGEPPPTRARAVLTRGERRAFVLVGLDPARRGAELALPEVAALRGLVPATPAPTTAAAAAPEEPGAPPATSTPKGRRRSTSPTTKAASPGQGAEESPAPTGASRSTAPHHPGPDTPEPAPSPAKGGTKRAATRKAAAKTSAAGAEPTPSTPTTPPETHKLNNEPDTPAPTPSKRTARSTTPATKKAASTKKTAATKTTSKSLEATEGDGATEASPAPARKATKGAASAPSGTAGSSAKRAAAKKTAAKTSAAGAEPTPSTPTTPPETHKLNNEPDTPAPTPSKRTARSTTPATKKAASTKKTAATKTTTAAAVATPAARSPRKKAATGPAGEP